MRHSSFIRDNLATIGAALVVAALVAALALWRRGAEAGGGRLVALVHDGAGQVHELPLSEDTTLVVETELGSNTVVVAGGSVRIAEADCPNGTCTREAPIASPGAQLVCLPHRLWVEVVPEGGAAGEMDVSLVDAPDDVDLVAR